METLTEDDLDYLTKVQNRLSRMRKRESANTNSRLMLDDIGEIITNIHTVRQWLQGRFDKTVDSDLDQGQWKTW